MYLHVCIKIKFCIHFLYSFPTQNVVFKTPNACVRYDEMPYAVPFTYNTTYIFVVFGYSMYRLSNNEKYRYRQNPKASEFEGLFGHSNF